MDRIQYLRFLKYVAIYWYLLPMTLISMIAATLLDLAAPWITGVVLIDRVIIARDASLLPWVALGLLGAIMLRQVFEFAHRYFLSLLSQRTIHHLRCDLYQHFEGLPVSFYASSPVGDLVSRQVSDTDALEEGLKAFVTEAGVHLVMVFGALGLLFALNVELTLLILPFLFLLAIVMHIFRKMVRGSSQRVRESMGRLATLTTETLSGISIVKAFTMERAELRRFRETSEDILTYSVRLARLEGYYHVTVEMILVSSVVVVIWLAGPKVLSDQMTVGALVAYLGYLARVQEPLKGLSKANFRIQKALGAAQRIFAVLHIPVEDRLSKGSIVLTEARGHLAFENVSFGYREDQPVLNNFSLTIRPGEAVALAGPSGVGKTTLVNLLLRFYSPYCGKILLDGHPLETLDSRSLRGQISLVNQDPFLFSTTVGDNILYGNPEASYQEVERAARAANIHGFIETLPQGYDTTVGQRGVALSGGQRQRIALARAFLKNGSILVLDEATTSVDSEAESLIQDALIKLMAGRTTLIIAHRLSTLHLAERIIILENGQISQEGSHEELLAGGGLYQRLYNLQVPT